MDIPQRIGLLLIGLVVLYGGALLWSLEESGHGLDFTLKGRFVYETGVDRPVFEGSRQEADDYMERRRAAVGRDFVLPGLIIVLGVALLIASFLPWQKLRSRAITRP
jgi:hypothetical protein